MIKPVVAALAVTSLALAACATAPMGGPAPYPPSPANGVYITTPYDPAQFAWSTQPGGNGIHGSSPRGFSCAKLSVALTPEGPYSRERIVKLYGSAVRADRPAADILKTVVVNDNPDLARFVRRARCDGQGRFSFAGLPDGNYFLIAQVAAPAGPLALMRHVVLRGGDIETVALTITAPR